MVRTLNLRQWMLGTLGCAIIGTVFVMAMWGPHDPTRAVGATSAITGLIVLLPSIIRRLADSDESDSYADESGIAATGAAATALGQAKASEVLGAVPQAAQPKALSKKTAQRLQSVKHLKP